MWAIGLNARQFANEIGAAVLQYAPLNKIWWKYVTDAEKSPMYSRLEKKSKRNATNRSKLTHGHCFGSRSFLNTHAMGITNSPLLTRGRLHEGSKGIKTGAFCSASKNAMCSFVTDCKMWIIQRTLTWRAPCVRPPRPIMFKYCSEAATSLRAELRSIRPYGEVQ
ncbi:Uncharacterized protein Fot_19056 [Forsythia ovata]|uniref:Uncharacterized protein n=1 Tax=Forsythia ovata TaxID=205694 RepID=A0ABD1VMS4_9LAMI